MIYLMPVSVMKLILSHLFFALLRPLTYFKTLVYLVTRPHPNIKLRLKTVLHFATGIYAAYILKDHPLDHIHAHFTDRSVTVALCIGRLLKLPYSFTAHAQTIFAGPVLMEEKFAESRFAVTVSEYNKAYLLKQYPTVKPEKIFVLHPWVEMDRFCPPETRSPQARLSILSIGRLVEKKGHEYLIEACHLLQKEGVDFECYIIGDGPLLARLEAIIDQRGLAERVHLMGAKPQSIVLASLAQADVFVLACIIAEDGDRDGMPVALAEAMAMQVPAISTNIVGIGEMVRPGAGYLVPPQDPAALAEAIKRIHSTDFASRLEMGKYGRSIIAREFDLYEGTAHLAELFRKSANGIRVVSLSSEYSSMD
jgi:glycosyltransferase involved in cell wall biosynthesis